MDEKDISCDVDTLENVERRVKECFATIEWPFEFTESLFENQLIVESNCCDTV